MGRGVPGLPGGAIHARSPAERSRAGSAGRWPARSARARERGGAGAGCVGRDVLGCLGSPPRDMPPAPRKVAWPHPARGGPWQRTLPGLPLCHEGQAGNARSWGGLTGPAFKYLGVSSLRPHAALKSQASEFMSYCNCARNRVLDPLDVRLRV